MNTKELEAKIARLEVSISLQRNTIRDRLHANTLTQADIEAEEQQLKEFKMILADAQEQHKRHKQTNLEWLEGVLGVRLGNFEDENPFCNLIDDCPNYGEVDCSECLYYWLKAEHKEES